MVFVSNTLFRIAYTEWLRKVRTFLRKKPIRRRYTTPTDSSMYGADDSLSVMATGESLEAEIATGNLERPTAKLLEGKDGLKYRPPSGRIIIQLIQSASERIQSSCAGIILYIVAM